MYSDNLRGSNSGRKSINLSQNITNAIGQLSKKFNMTSVKPHLNHYECWLNLIINGKMNLPLKIVFLRNYPIQRPIIYCQKWIKHNLVKIQTCQIQYQTFYQWDKTKSLIDLLTRLQGQFSKNLPIQKSQVDLAIQKLDQYLRDIQSLRTKPPGTQPPPPPNINFQNILKVFQYQQNLKSQCEQRNTTYLLNAQQYQENVQQIKCISDKYSKGKILTQMQKQLKVFQSNTDKKDIKLDDIMKSYYQNRKEYHKLNILKEKYLEM